MHSTDSFFETQQQTPTFMTDAFRRFA